MLSLPVAGLVLFALINPSTTLWPSFENQLRGKLHHGYKNVLFFILYTILRFLRFLFFASCTVHVVGRFSFVCFYFTILWFVFLYTFYFRAANFDGFRHLILARHCYCNWRIKFARFQNVFYICGWHRALGIDSLSICIAQKFTSSGAKLSSWIWILGHL